MTPAEVQPGAGLPRPLRHALLGCLFLSGLVGYFAATEAFALGELSAMQVRAPAGADPQLLRLAQAQTEAVVRAARGMRESRTVVLAALAVSCALVFVAAARTLQPFGAGRAGMLRMLGGTALTTAVLRTLDGAQWAVISRRAGAAIDRAAVEGVELPMWIDGLGTLVTTGWAIGQTTLVAGAFLFFSRYFHSLKVRQTIELADRG